MDLLVLVEQRVWDDFREAVAGIGERWTGPSGRNYRLALTGDRLEVYLVVDVLEAAPGGDEIDADLFALAQAVYDAVGGDWSAEALRRTAEVWGYVP